MLKKLNLPDKEQEKWMKVLTPNFQSSEESDDDDDEVKTLPWRSDRVSAKFKELDEKNEAKKTPQARRQRRRRVVGVHNSTRCVPPNAPKWSVAK